MASNPALFIRVSATIEDLKRSLAEGKNEITAAGQQMIASTVALQGRLAIAESAARLAGDAQLKLADAIAKAGGPTEGQASQMAQLSAQLLAARGNVAAVREEIDAIAQATAGATPAVGNLKTAMGQFDSILAALGVNIGPEVRSLGELGEASGKTASQLGMIGVAGLAVGAAIGGWKIGRAVADFFDLDKQIGDGIAKLLGWGDVAGQKAAADADMLARASTLAGIAITDMALALAINEEHAKTSAAALAARTVETKSAAQVEKEAADAIHEANQRMLKDLAAELAAMKPFREAMVELNAVGVGWKGTLDTIDGTVVEAIKFYLQAGVSQKALADAYQLTDAQVRAIASSLKDEQEQQHKAAQTTADHAKAARDAADALDKEAEQLKKVKEHAQAVAAAEREAAEAKKALNRAMGNTLDVAHAVAADPALAELLHMGWSLENAEQILLSRKYGFTPKLFSPKGNPENSPDPSERVPWYASGVRNAPGGWAMVGERGPEPMYVPPGADIYPSGTHAGGGLTMHVYVTQPLGTSAAIAAAVSDAVTTNLRAQGFRF